MKTTFWKRRYDVAKMKACLNLAVLLAVALAVAEGESEVQAPGPPAPDLCGINWVAKTNDKCYQNSWPAKAQFKLAKKICKEKGGILATPRTEEENEIILSMDKKVKASPENEKQRSMDLKSGGYWMDANMVNGKWVAGDKKEPMDYQPQIGKGCETGWIPYKGSCYQLGTNLLSWQHATDDCELNKGAKLALPTSREMSTFLFDLPKRQFWIRAQLNTESMTWKDWTKESQIPLTWTDWNGLKDVKEEGVVDLCALVGGFQWDFQWIKIGCHVKSHYICVKDEMKVGSKDKCRLLVPSIGWMEAPCESSTHYFICEKKKKKPPEEENIKPVATRPSVIISCPHGWTLHREFCYKHFTVRVFQREAQVACKEHSAFLVLPLNKDENYFVHKLAKQKFSQWINAHRPRPARTTGGWLNANMELIQWTNWPTGGNQWHNSILMDCAYIDTGNPKRGGGKWKEMWCHGGTKRTYSCKKAATKVPVPPPETTTTTTTKEPEKVAKWKVPFYATCYPACDATLYRGTIRKTESGRDCQMWSEQEPHKHGYANSWYDFVDFTWPNNYCRDTKYGYKGKPWCFTADPTKQWEFCTVPKCEFTMCFPACDGSLYRGDVSETVSGKKCQDWQNQEPHNHMIGMDGADFVDGELPSNLCRTLESHDEYDEEGGVVHSESEVPWCYTTDGETVIEQCGVRDCAYVIVDYPSADMARGDQAAGADHVTPMTSLVTWLCVLCALAVCWSTWQ